MSPALYDPRPLDQTDPDPAAPPIDWLWDGYLARGRITLLTSTWKAGKTTLAAGLLRALGPGVPFLGRPVAAGQAVVVSEEAPGDWAARGRDIPVGPHARLVSRPFPRRPSPAEWDALVGAAEAGRAARPLDLFVVDPLATFLPGRTEADAGALLDFLDPLRRLAAGGTAVLVLHHPRRGRSEEGSSARGCGALLGYVDVVLELHRYGTLAADATRRRLVGLSRRRETPGALVYEWAPGTPDFRAVADPLAERFRDQWATVRGLLAARPRPATNKELLADWPADREPPSAAVLYQWLARAVGEGLAERTGHGTRYEPFRFGLPDKRRPRLPDLDPL